MTPKTPPWITAFPTNVLIYISELALSGLAADRTAKRAVLAPERRSRMSQRELIEPHKGDKRYQRRKEDGTFAESDDQSRSLSADSRQQARNKKPRNQGDKGD